MGTQFVQIPRKFLEMDKGTKFVDVLVYSIIDNQKDSSTYTSKIGQSTIAEKYDIPLSKVEDAIKRLKESGYIDYTQHPSPNNPKHKYNVYTFPLMKNGKMKEGFLMLNPEVLTQPLKPKDRGVLIYLQLIALPNMNDIAETKMEDIAKLLKITRQTASKYIKAFLDSNQITKGRCSYKCKYLAKAEAEEDVVMNNKLEFIID
jgi:DNA-binding MarR family transcriptional regulator